MEQLIGLCKGLMLGDSIINNLIGIREERLKRLRGEVEVDRSKLFDVDGVVPEEVLRDFGDYIASKRGNVA